MRGTHAGAAPFPFVIYNDNYEFDGYITAVSNSGFADVLWSPEVRSESGHKAPPTAVAGKLDATANPYEVPAAAREVKDEYLFGDALLVAPIAPNVKSRKVLLPAGKWYDFYTGKFAGENQTIEVTPSLSEMPVFVKDGALIPMLVDKRQWVPAATETVALEVRHYGEAAGKLVLYDDDGETFDYEKGEYSWTQLTATKDASSAWSETVLVQRECPKWAWALSDRDQGG